MPGAGGERVMIVVPAFAEADDGDREVVGAVIGAFERPAAPDVADGVDAPWHVLKKKVPQHAAPYPAGNNSLPRAVPQSQRDAGKQNAEEYPEEIELIDQQQRAIFEKSR